MNYKFLILLSLLILPFASGAETWYLHFSDGTSTINATDVCIDDGTCLSTIAAGTGNESWNETWANTLYADIGVVTGNASWNETWANLLYADIGVITDNQSWNQTWANEVYIVQTNESNLNVNSSTWWADISGWVSGWFQQTGDDLEFNESRLNATIDNRLEVEYFNATSAFNTTGTYGTNLSDNYSSDILDIQLYDGVYYNITETASDLELLVNFTNVTDFSSLIVRHKVDVVGTHTASIQLWDYPGGRWEGYGYLGETLTSEIQTFGVYDSSEHINNTVVQARFYQDGTPPNTAHVHSFDWVILSKGFGTPTGTEIDPLSFHTNLSINNTGFNISANYIFGDGSFLTNVGFNISWNETWANTLYAKYLFTDNDFNGTGNFITLGNISIGGIELSQKLVIDSGDINVPAFFGLRMDNDNKFIKLGNPASDVSHISVDDNDALAFGQEDSFVGNASTFVELMRIERLGGTDDPQVGINESNPSHTLDLVGDFELTGSLFASSNITVEKIVFETTAANSIMDNATCVIIGGATSIFEVC